MNDVKQITCDVIAIQPLTQYVYQVRLAPRSPVQFVAGQYISVVMSAQDYRPFSIASIPSEQRFIELHIGATPENPYAWEVLEKLRTQSTIDITAPQGIAGYRTDSERPLILIAGGTGFSYTWSIAAAHLESESPRPLVFYWGAKQLSDLYKHEQLLELAKQDARFSYRPVLEEPPEGWPFAQGWVHHAVLADYEHLEQADVYIAGRFEMVKTARDDFYRKGLPKSQLMGDALSFID